MEKFVVRKKKPEHSDVETSECSAHSSSNEPEETKKKRNEPEQPIPTTSRHLTDKQLEAPTLNPVEHLKKKVKHGDQKHDVPASGEEIYTSEPEDESGEGLSKTSTTQKKRSRIKKFSSSWLQVPEFKGWLQKSNNTKDGHDLAFCKICFTNITAHKHDLLRHCQSDKHKQRAKEIVSNKDLRKEFESPLQTKVKIAEIKVAALLAENNLPFSLMDVLCETIPKIFPDSPSACKLNQHRTKATAVIKNCLSKEFEKELCCKLIEQSSFYSIIVDETTDCSSVKECAIVIIYFDSIANRLQTKFIELIEMPSATAQNLVACIKSCLEGKNIPITNMVGFSADTTNVMFGENVSVSALLKQELPYIASIKCSCHMLHLAASKACMKLPRSLEDLLRNLGSHFSRSFCRQEKFREFQEFFRVEIHKILSPSNTRWLSLKACVDRVLEQFVALQEYLRVVVFEDPSRTTEEMLSTMSNKFMEVYLEFLSHTLGLFTSANLMFQSESPLLYKVKPEIESLMKSLCACYIDMKVIRGKNILELDHTDEAIFVPFDKVHFGLAAHESLHRLRNDPKLEEGELNRFIKTCIDFCIEAVTQLKKRFQFTDPLYNLISAVDPFIAQSDTCEVQTLAPVVTRFPQLKGRINSQELDQEWRHFCLLEHEKHGLLVSMKAEDYWKKVFSLKNVGGMPLYPNMKEVISLLLVLPFSNASVERVFSNLNNCKTTHRNRMKTSTLSALLKTKDGLKELGGVKNFEPSTQMLKAKLWN